MVVFVHSIHTDPKKHIKVASQLPVGTDVCFITPGLVEMYLPNYTHMFVALDDVGVSVLDKYEVEYYNLYDGTLEGLIKWIK